MINKVFSGMLKKANLFLIALSIAAGAFVIITNSGTGIEQSIERVRERMMPKTASGNVVVIAIDQESLTQLEVWPWPRSLHGKLVDRLNEYGVSRIVFDVDFSSHATDTSQDIAFAKSLKKSKAPVYLLGGEDEIDGKRIETQANDLLLPYVTTVNGWINVEPKNGEITLPISESLAGTERIGIAAALSNTSERNGHIEVDWAIGYRTVPVISYSDIINGNIPKNALKDKAVVIGATAMTMGDRWTVPDGYRIPGVIIHAMAAETIWNGLPRNWGGEILFIFTGVFLALSCLGKSRVIASLTIAMTAIASIGISWVIQEQFNIVLTVAASLTVIIIGLIGQFIAAITIAIMTKITTNEITDLPNLSAMRIEAPAGKSTVAVRLLNHLDTATALGTNMQAELLRRARDRIRLAAGDEQIYQVDEHSFAWRTNLEGNELSDAIEGLVLLFIGGLQLNGKMIDTTIAAGIAEDKSDINEAVTCALIAADHAEKQGLVWTRHEDNAADAQWRITMMSELDNALKGVEGAGNVWVAYQPKYDLKTNSIISSEALIRWNHPERGPVRPDHFIPVIEEAGRIENLTLYVLETAVRDFAKFDNIGVAVNLSTRMLGYGKIVEPVRKYLDQYGLKPELLTLEITESAVLTGQEAIEELKELRDMGVKISIDDYGTGQSTLNYIKKLPATELKVDQSFIRGILTSKSDQVMISSTINLAHELGLKVVAEGVETEEILEMLRSLDCDIIQGYFIGKPVEISEFTRNMAEQIVAKKTKKTKAA